MTKIMTDDRGSQNAVIEGKGLVKRFGRTTALSDLDIAVPRGSVYALLGRNGAGKSTLIQMLMGMLEPTEGSVRVLGHDPLREPIALKQGLGYIPERMPMYDWMTVDQALAFVAAFYHNWSRNEEERLVKQFRLDRTQKVGALSRGTRALLSLVMAMAHQPELVLLDECTSGMDAIARREFERTVIDALSGSGRTVLFAGHQIDELERICDWVGIMSAGKMLLQMPLDELKRTVVTLRLEVQNSAPGTLPGCRILDIAQTEREAIATVWLDNTAVELTMPQSIKLLEIITLSLEEIFVAVVEQEMNQ